MKIFAKNALFTLLISLISYYATAQTARNFEQMRDGYFVQNGQMKQISNGKISNLNQDVTLKDGTKVTTEGTIIHPDGTKEKITSGHAVNTDGIVVLLDHDMMKAEAIRQHEKKMLGNTTTEIILTEKGISVVEPAQREKWNRRTELLDQKLSTLQETSNLLEAKIKLLEAQNPNVDKEQLKQINEKISNIDQKLKANQAKM